LGNPVQRGLDRQSFSREGKRGDCGAAKGPPNITLVEGVISAGGKKRKHPTNHSRPRSGTGTFAIKREKVAGGGGGGKNVKKSVHLGFEVGGGGGINGFRKKIEGGSAKPF